MYIEGIYCSIWLQCFQTREMIVNHIRYESKKCRISTFVLGPCLSPEAADFLDMEEKGRHEYLYASAQLRSIAEVPCYRMTGPLLSREQMFMNQNGWTFVKQMYKRQNISID